MASITFKGPSTTEPGKQSLTVVELDDMALLAAVEAVCMTRGYTGTQPGLFAIQQIINDWTDLTRTYNENKGIQQVRKQVEAQLEPLTRVSITVNGEPVQFESTDSPVDISVEPVVEPPVVEQPVVEPPVTDLENPVL